VTRFPRRRLRDGFPLSARSLALALGLEGALFGAGFLLVPTRAAPARALSLRADETAQARERDPGPVPIG